MYRVQRHSRCALVHCMCWHSRCRQSRCTLIHWHGRPRCSRQTLSHRHSRSRRTLSQRVYQHRRCIHRPSKSSCRQRSCMLGAHRLQRRRQGRHSLSRRYRYAVSGVHRGYRHVSMLRTRRLTTGRHPTVRKERWCHRAWWQAYRQPKAKINWSVGGRWRKEGRGECSG